MEFHRLFVVGLLLFSSSPGFAVLAPANPRPEDFDKRIVLSPRVATASPERELALSQLHARRPQVQVTFDPVTGSPKSIAAASEFLSGSNGVAGSVPPGTALTFAPNDQDRATKNFLEEYRGLFHYGSEALDSARVMRNYTTAHNGLRTVVWQQEVDGIPVFDAVMISHTTRHGELVSLSSQFLPDADGAVQRGGQNRANLAPSLQLSAAQALVIAASGIGEQLSGQAVVPQRSQAEVEADPMRKQVFRTALLKGDATVALTWLPMNSSQLRLCWDIILMGRSSREMFRVLVDAATGEVLLRHCLTTDISDATYRVFTSDSPSPYSPGYPIPTNAQPPLVQRSLVTLPALDINASPNGWIDDGVNETRGNNVDAHTDLNDDDLPDLPRPQGSPFRVFDFPLDLNTQPSTYRNAAVVQLFYWCNWMHDQLYDLGFTEAAGNFQNTNFNRGGVAGDAVQADAQDGGGLNNANFTTPPDGMPGRMQMYVFSSSGLDRDGDLDAEIILHEYTHGLSNRRVGGGVGISDLQPQGMGEGWSDFYALTLLSEPSDDLDGNYAMAAYALRNYYFGIRRYPYSTDMTRNPLTFKDIDPTRASSHPGIPVNGIIAPASEVHNMGEIWCVTLWETRANLIRKYGWATGNRLILQLVTDGMALSPPNPTFLQARDAILQADMVDTGGTNQVELWQAFAKRGLGATATCPASTTSTGVQESFQVPDDLQVNPFSGRNFSYQSGKVPVPVCLTYQLSNVGSNALNWSAFATAPWISLAVSNGVIAPGDSNAVIACLNSSANDLFGGDYFGSVIISNTASGYTQSRLLALHLNPPQVLFDSLDAQPPWSFNGEWQFGQPHGSGGTQYGYPDPTAGATGTNVFGINLNGDYSLASGGSNYLTAGPFDFTGVTDVSLHFQRWLNSDFQPYVFETIQVSTDGTNWTPVWDNGQTAETTDNTWTPVSYDLSTWADNHSNVYVRWGHRVASTLAFPYSGWNIDDVEFWGNPPPQISLNLPPTVDVSSGVQTGIVTIAPIALTNLMVSLTSSDSAVAGVPDSVLIPAGQSSTVFNIKLTNQLSATTTVTVTAAAPGYLAGVGGIQVSDSNAVTLHLSLPAAAVEGDGTLTGTATIRDPQTNDLTVELSSSDPSSLQVPDSVTIPQGQTNAVFPATIIDDTAINGSRNVTITAQSAGWTDAVAMVFVQDNESLDLMVTVPENVWENAGVLSNAGTISISGTLTNDLIVALASSAPTRLAVPDKITIPAGQTSANFDITPIDNLVSDGNRSVRINASAAGFTNGSASITVLDDEAPSPASNPTPPHLATNIDSAVVLAWENDYLPGAITNDVYFGTNPSPGPSELMGSTTNESWALPLLAPQTTYYWQVVTHRVGVATGPVWQFTTRGLDHLTWNPVSSPQYVNQPFAVTVVARDAHDSVVSNFNGTVQLQGAPAGISSEESGVFVDGMWQGNVAVTQWASGESLTAGDGADHTGTSNPFDVVLTNDVAISISVGANPAPVGAPLTYILTVTNTGADIAADVQVTDLLPSRVIVNSVTVSQGSWHKTNDVLTADLGTIAGATNATVTIELTPNTFGDVLTNVASVARAEPDAYPDNNVATNTTTVGFPALSITDTTAPEANSGTTNALFTVRLSAPSSDPVTVIYATADGSAHAGTDYVGTNGILVLPPGAATAVIPVAVIGNAFAEPGRDFQVTLSDSTNAVLSRAQATGTILNGSTAPEILNHFDWTVIPSPQHTKVSFDVRVTAIDTNGELAATFDRLVAFSTSTADVRFHPAVSGTFTNGEWQGQFTVDDPGAHLVLKADDYGDHSGQSAAFDVVPYNMPPAILSPPIGHVVTNGAAVAFSVVADGTPPLSYQWTFNGTNVADATNSTLTLSSAQSTDAGDYVVLVSNEFGSEESSPARLSAGDPPVITSQPIDQLTTVGQAAAFGVTAIGTEPLNYQWSHDGNDLSDATNATLIVTNAQLTDAGNYSVRVFNLFGTQTSSNAMLAVGLVPKVTTEPTNLALAVGSDATFIVEADGTAPITFQWTFNGTNILDATNSTLALTDVQMTDSGEYAVQVFNAFGTDQSSNAALTVGHPPLITGQPINQTVVLGTDASFTVATTGTEPLNYQWNHEGADLPNATNATLIVTSAQLADAGNYAVRISNLFGTQTSSNALLTVGTLPSVTTQPTNAAVAVGSNTVFTVEADGSAPLTFQWTFNGTNILDATNSTLELTNVQMTDTGEYAVQVFNAFGTDQSSNAALTIGDSPLITSQPINQTVALGTDVSFTVATTGTEPLNYQWIHEGSDLPDATNATLIVTNAQLAEAGNYAVRVFNLFGTQTSSNALLTVGILPSVTTQPTNAAVAVGGEVTFDITADGTAPLTFQWTFNGTNILDATNSTLVLTNVQMTDAGEYAVQVFNAFGTDQSSNAVLTVGDSPLITSQPINQTVVLGTDASFTVATTGTEPLTYQWSHEGTDLADATNATLIVTNAQLADAGNYAVRIFNPFGTQTSSNALLTVGILPSVTIQPTNAAVAVGGNATFAITADGSAPLTFQWTFNGTNILDATNSTLVLTNVQMTDAGEYAVQVFNAFGTDQSSNAVLTVGDSPLITSQPTDQVTTIGQAITFGVTATGTEPLNYQWSHEGTDLADATNATLIVTNAQLADAGNYAVRIFNPFGAQTSSNALLTVGILPSVTTQPTNAAVAVGGEATFVITADGTAPLSFQWTFNGTNILDATNSALMLTNVQMSDAGEYAVQVFNSFGTDQSSNVVLQVLPICTPPPSGMVGWWGADGSAADSVTGLEGLMTNVTFAPGKMGLAFLFNNTNSAVNLGDPSSLKFTNSFSIEAWIWINQLPSTQQGQAQIFFRGQSDPCLDPYFLSLTADGTLRFHIADGSESPCGADAYTATVATGEWMHVAAVLDVSNETMSVFLNGDLATQVNTAMQPFADLQDGGAVIGNRISQGDTREPFDGLIDEVSAYNRALSIDEIRAIRDAGSAGKCLLPPVLLAQPAALSVAAGSNAVLESAAGGSPLLHFQWSLNGTNIFDATNSLLTFTNVQPADAGQYVVTVTNAAGFASSVPVTLTVVLPPVIVSQPTNQAVPTGTTALFRITASGTAPFYYQWRRGNVDLIDDGRVLGANSDTLIISNLQPTDSDFYSVVITNLAGVAVSSNAALLVYALDHFAWDPIPPARFVNVPFPVRIQALDASNNPVAAFPGPVLLTNLAGDAVQPQQSGNFTNGVWSGFLTLTQKTSGTVLEAADGLGHVGDANAFDVVDLPALTLQRSGRSVVISWSAYGPVFTPETSSDLVNWSAAQLPIDLISTQFRIRVAITDTNTFYRLRFIGP